MLRWQIAVAAAVALFAAPAAPAAEYVKLVHCETGKVLSVADDSEENEAKVVLAADGDGKSQQWEVVKDGDFVKIVNRKSAKVLDVAGESQDEGGDIIQFDAKDEGNDNQRWAWAGDGDEKRLKSKSSELVLEADGDGKVVQKKLDDKAKAQLWKVKKVRE